MKLDEIHESWNKDARIDTTDLQESAANVPVLHSKYYQIYSQEKKILNILVKTYSKLRKDKTEFLINPTEEDVKEKGWKVPERGKLYKAEIPAYLDGDEELLELEHKIKSQEDKLDFLKSVIQTILSRGYLIKNIIEDRKYMQGG